MVGCIFAKNHVCYNKIKPTSLFTICLACTCITIGLMSPANVPSPLTIYFIEPKGVWRKTYKHWPYGEVEKNKKSGSRNIWIGNLQYWASYFCPKKKGSYMKKYKFLKHCVSLSLSHANSLAITIQYTTTAHPWCDGHSTSISAYGV